MLIHSYANHLKYFVDTATFNSFTEAAEKNFVSQSAISQAIKKLEFITGTKLLVHHRNHFQLTAEGKLLFEKAKSLMREFSDLDEFLLKLKDKTYGKIHFGCMHSIALATLGKTMPVFQKKFPHVEIAFSLSHGGHVQEAVRKGEIDFGIVLDNDDLSGFETIELHSGNFSLFSSKKSVISKKYILSEPSFETNLLKKHYKKAYKKPMGVQMQVASWEVIASLTEAGAGIGFFPDYLAKNHPNLRKVETKLPKIPYAMVAIFHPKAHISDHALSFLKHFKRAF